MPVCSACDHDNPGEARFCNQCGNALAPARREGPSPREYTPAHLADRVLRSAASLRGERKQVTVLFVDVKGSAQLARQAGAEGWHDILDRLFALLTEAVHRYGGTVNQYTGDGIMALFGAPIAYEDHALRAAHAALDIRSQVRAYADRLRLDQGLNLSLRTGMNSGEVVVGAIGDDLRMDYTAQGHTVNLAARMESIAESGRVYLAQDTAALIDGYFQLRDLGETSVAGVDEPVRVFELLKAGAIDTRLQLSRRRGLSRFVGRDAEIAQMEQALSEVREAGDGRVLAVSGNAGIGKSRLCHEFAERCRTRGLELYSVHAVAYAEAMPYWPIQQLLRSVFDITEQDNAEAARRKVAGALLLENESARASLGLIFDFLGLDAADGASDVSADERMRRLQAMAIKAMTACDEPIVIVIEDAHWLDAGSVDFFQSIMAALDGAPVLLVFNHRSDYVLEWLWSGAHVEIVLHALSGQALESLLEERLGSDASLTDLRNRIAEQAAGNPYFIEEAVLDLAERRVLTGVAGAYCLEQASAELHLPDTVQAILAARIDRLPARDKSLLHAAAVIGKTFSRELLGMLCECPAAQLEDALLGLEEAGFVHVSDAASKDYAFCHPLIQEVAYDSQLQDTRRGRHAQLAGAIEAGLAQPDEAGEAAVLLAHHWRLARQPERAAGWSLRAGIWLSQHDIRAALTHFRAAVSQLPVESLEPALVHTAISARAAMLRVAGLVPVPEDEVRAAYEQARALTRQVADVAGEMELALSYGMWVLLSGEAQAALEHMREALRISNDQQVLARFRLPILNVYFVAGSLREGLDALAASGPWEQGAITEENLSSRGLRALLIGLMGDLPLARKESMEALAVAGAGGMRLSWLYSNLVEFAWLAQESERSQEWAQRAVEWSNAHGSAMFAGMAYRALGMAQLMAGQPELAARNLRELCDGLAPGVPGYQFVSAHHALLAQAESEAANVDAAFDAAERAIAKALRGGMRAWQANARLSMARLLLRYGGGDVQVQLDSAGALIEETGSLAYAPQHAELCAQAAQAVGERETAQSAFSRARQLYDQIGAPLRAQAMDEALAVIQKGVNA